MWFGDFVMILCCAQQICGDCVHLSSSAVKSSCPIDVFFVGRGGGCVVYHLSRLQFSILDLSSCCVDLSPFGFMVSV